MSVTERFILMLLSMFLPQGVVGAQQPTSNERCAVAARLVSAGEATNEHAGWALAHIVRCPQGPTVIAAQWRAAGDHPDWVPQLRAWHYQLRDQRIADAALATARDGTRSTEMRLLGIQVSVSYFDPNATVEWEDLLNPGRRTPSLAFVTDLQPRLGGEPPNSSISQDVYRLVHELSTDRDSVVARAAKFVWQALTDTKAGAAMLPPGTVTLENVCGAKYRVTNHSDLGLSVSLESPNGLRRGFRLTGHQTIEMSARDTGDVRLMLHGGVQAASGRSSLTLCR